MGPGGLYLNSWGLNFNPTIDGPTVILAWVKLSHLPMHLWNEDIFKAIGNSLGKYIDSTGPKRTSPVLEFV